MSQVYLSIKKVTETIEITVRVNTRIGNSYSDAITISICLLYYYKDLSDQFLVALWQKIPFSEFKSCNQLNGFLALKVLW